MAAIAAVLVVQAVVTAAQVYQQRQAAGAARSELDKIRKAYENLTPPDFPPIDSPPQLIAETAEVVDYDLEKLTPENFKVIGEFSPEIAPYIAQQRPELVKDSAIGQEGIQAQMSALRRLQDIGEGGIDPQFAQRMKEASTNAQIAAQSRQESLLQDYERRGLLGSGTQLAAELAGNEGAMQRAGQMSGDAAAQAYLNQLGALKDSANLGGSIRGQEIDLASRNANIANAFNQRTSAAYQNYLQNATRQRNEAAVNSLANRQNIDNANVEQRNQYDVQERNRQDSIKEKIRQQKIQNMAAENAVKQQGWNNQLSYNQARDNQAQQKFDNEAKRIGGQSNVAKANINQINNQLKYNTNAAQGVGEAFASGANYYDRQAAAEKAESRRNKIDSYLYPGIKFDEEEDQVIG